jgi:diguanylate cyclase (GGDEF)-like protein
MTNNKQKNVSKLLALQNIFIEELPSRLDTIQAAWNKGDVADSGEFHRLVHSLSGSAGTFGFPRLGNAARELELLIQQQKGSFADLESNLMIEQDLLLLRDIAQKGPDKMMSLGETLPEQQNANNETPALVYILEDDINLAKETQQQLQHFGYTSELFHNTNDLQAGVARQVPDALLADIHHQEGFDAGPGAAVELRKSAPQEVPVIFASGHNTWQDRLSAVRAGGQAYLSKPINFSLLIEQLDIVTGRKQESNYRIVIVDDTELLAKHYAAVLEEAGMKTTVLNNPEKILDVLAVFRPDLILMDIYMPGCSGIEVAQVIRQHTDFTNMPIVYLSTEKALDQQLQALQVGGDDFLQKPISDSHLVAAVRIRARRFRELSALMNQDSLTGLLNHINLKLALEREIAQAARRASVLSFVMLDIDKFKLVNDTYGHPVGDQVIKSLARLLSQRLRKGDIAARYGGEEFALILPDTSAVEAYNLINDLRQQFSKIIYSDVKGDFNSTFSGGIASSPPYTEMDQLIAAADKALYKAKHEGCNQIIMDGRSASN